MSQSSPTAPELDILKSLWESAPASARELHERVGEPAGWSLSTTRTVIRRMRDKGHLAESKVHGVTVYAPVSEKARTLAALARDFFGRVLERSAPLPASAFAESGILDADEAEEIARLLGEVDEDQTQSTESGS